MNIIPWIIIVALYILGCIGFHDMARDLQGGPIRQWRSWRNLFLWPITFTAMKSADIYDHLTTRK